MTTYLEISLSHTISESVVLLFASIKSFSFKCCGLNMEMDCFSSVVFYNYEVLRHGSLILPFFKTVKRCSGRRVHFHTFIILYIGIITLEDPSLNTLSWYM